MLALSTVCSRRDWEGGINCGETHRAGRMHPANHSPADGLTLGLALPKKSSAMPPDVRKAFGLPASPRFGFWAMPNLLGRSPEFITNPNGSAERFRTSGGIAESRESLFRQSHSGWIAGVTRFRQTPKSEPKSKFPVLVFLDGAGQSAVILYVHRLRRFQIGEEGRPGRYRSRY